MLKEELLFIIPTMRGAGAEKALLNILNRLDYNKYNVSLLLFNHNGELYNLIPSKVKKYHLYSKFRPFIPFIENRFTRNIFWKLRSLTINPFKKFDAIISFLEGEALLTHNLLLNRRNKDITWVHINLMVNHWSKNVFKNHQKELEAYKKMDEIIFVSNDAQKAFNKFFQMDIESKVIYNIIDRDDIIKKAKEKCPIKRSSKFVISNVGRLTKQKRQDRLIEAIAILNHKYGVDTECWILGQGELEEKLKQHAKDLKIEEKIKFLGFRSNPYPFVKESDIFMLSSDTEGYPLVVCEALCLGKPILSTDITGPNEILSEGGGILTELSAEALAEATHTLLKDQELINKKQNEAIVISNSFSTKEIMNQIYAIL